MPIYTYQTPSGPVDEIRNVGDRDKGKFPRALSSIHVSNGAQDPNSAEAGAKRYYRETELKGEKVSSKYTKNQIKSIWGI
jgi:hypothetical protein